MLNSNKRYLLTKYDILVLVTYLKLFFSSMMQLYRKNFVDMNRRDFLNKFNSFLEAKQYTETLDSVKKAKLALGLLQ